jgi:hypothetical protein
MNSEFEQLVEQYMNFDKKALAQLLAQITLYGTRTIPYPMPYPVPYPYEVPSPYPITPIWVYTPTTTKPVEPYYTTTTAETIANATYTETNRKDEFMERLRNLS